MVAYAGYCELSGPRTRAANTSDYADLAPGDKGLICSFGAGYSVGSAILERA